MKMVCWLVAFLLGSSALYGQRQIDFIPGAGPVFRAEVNFNQFAAAYQPQWQSQWCWAAAISNIFSYYGHPVSQARIVAEVYGGAVNMPAMAAVVIAQQVNRRWVDDNGVAFTARLTGAYDAQAGILNINNAFMLNELKQGRPILVCNASHCMVMTAIDFTNSQVVGAGVFDPWPGKGARKLSPAELLPRHNGGELSFLGSLSVR